MEHKALSFDYQTASYDAIFPDRIVTEKNFGGELGFVAGFALNRKELEIAKDAILEHLAKNVSKISHDAEIALTQNGLKNYHIAVDDELHKKCLSKESRTLPPSLSKRILKSEFFQYIQDLVGNYELADEEGRGFEQICFRVCRPNKSTDVGSIHCDTWFWDYHGFNLKPGYGRFKVWFQIEGNPHSSGLLLVPSSHKHPQDYKVTQTNNKLEFIRENSNRPDNLCAFTEPLGTPVMFNHDLLHGGQMNTGDTCRISFELTVIFKETHEPKTAL